jgi:uncharacterized cupin superfamily protein/DNA-binding XRE family transcriptional regulator
MSEEAQANPVGLQPSLDLGARLRAQRLSTGLSLREMARRLKRSPSAISQFETGKARPSVSTLFEMVELLGTSIDSLLGAEEVGGETAAADIGAGNFGAAGLGAGRVGGDGHGPAERDAAGRDAARRGRDGQGADQRGADGTGGPVTGLADLGAGLLDMPNRVILERAADHPCIELENTVQWTRLSRSMSGVEFLLVTYPPGAWSSGADGRFMRHAGHEFAYLLNGLLTVEISFDNHLDSYEVRAGDSITFPAAMAHRLGNRSTEPATAIWCIFAAGGSGVHKNGVRVSPADGAAAEPADPPAMPPGGRP